ncbi:IPT/TIG domain-containing protein [Telluribacter sp. SYSU D00476]|uniref:IPT/TIG domain-containing protein n=1 Tax=Telluribacter sp. SYSU D00476 TaxID=2811430 RepID=UPI001FF6DD15|nr:IPT/TIG domain-containing protein [Telluribacter sp. SYSU D00476]
MRKPQTYPLALLPLLAVALVNCDKTTEPEPGTASGITITAITPAAGNTGDRVMITGSGFSANLADNTIRFGDVDAYLDSASATCLVTRVPKDAENCQLGVSVKGKRVLSTAYFNVHQIAPAFNTTGTSANEMDNLTSSFVRVASTLDIVGSRTIVEHGHVWSNIVSQPLINQRGDLSMEHPDYNAYDGQTENGIVSASDGHPYRFASYIQNLKPDTEYTIRAYVTTKSGMTYYGPASTFRTKRRN